MSLLRLTLRGQFEGTVEKREPYADQAWLIHT